MDAVDPMAELQNAGPMGGDDASAVLTGAHNIGQDLFFRFHIQSAGGFVQQEDRRIGQERSCNA